MSSRSIIASSSPPSAQGEFRLFALLGCLLVAAFVSCAVAMLAQADDKVDRVEHVYVIRRALAGQPINRVGNFGHSALLLKTESGNCYVLEYMGDSQAHLTKAEQKTISHDKKRQIARIKMAGWTKMMPAEFEWERQLAGQSIEPAYTPDELRELMQGLMRRYSVWNKEHCHTAQERLRLFLGAQD